MKDLIDLASGVDGIVQMQAKADAEYFFRLCARSFPAHEAESIRSVVLKAYRWRYIVSGAQEQRFIDNLTRKINPAQGERIGAALAPLIS